MRHGVSGTRAPPGRLLVIVTLLVVAAAAAAISAVVVSGRRPAGRLSEQGTSGTAAGPSGPSGAGPLHNGAAVPAADLVSDPVFVTNTTGYALATTERADQQVERLARSTDGGRRWFVWGAEFPVTGGFSTLELIGGGEGFAFGPAGLVRTSDGGAHWYQVPDLGGELERVIPIGDNVWATFAVCSVPPDTSAPCPVEVAVSSDGGRTFRRTAPPPVSESPQGGDVLARVSDQAAYVLSYGTGGSQLAYTADGGRSWERRADPCVGSLLAADLAAPEDAFLWLICGGMAGPLGEPKSIFQSADGGVHWELRATTGLVLGQSSPVGAIPLSGVVSQLATITPERAWLGLSGVGAVVSFDAGRTWTRAEGLAAVGPRSSVGVTFNNALDGWVIVFRHGVWRTTDAVHWRLVAGG